MENVALGVKVFQRDEDLTRLLNSVPQKLFERIYIADDGRDNPSEKATSRANIDIPTTIIDLEYDAGNGYARREIVEEFDEEYLLMVDADHTIPDNISTLYRQLRSREDLGGVAGSIAEPPKNRVWQSGKNLREEDGGLIRTSSGEHDVSINQGAPFVYFDFVPQAILLKRSCLESYSWDRNYTTASEHLDFFVGHWKNTKWNFAVSPGVFFGHYPGGGESYESHRRSDKKQRDDLNYFLEKWDYEFVETKGPYWFNSDHSTVEHRIRETLNQDITDVISDGASFASSLFR